MYLNIDREKYPDRYKILEKRIKELQVIKIENADTVKYAGFWRRLIANIIDTVLVYAPLGAILFFTVRQSMILGIIEQIVLPLTALFYFTYSHAKHGRTIGKALLGMEVRKVDFTSIGWKTAFIRSSVDYVVTIIAIAGSVTGMIMFYNHNPGAKIPLQINNLIVTVNNSIAEVASSLSFFWALSEFITLLFNKKKRAVHDLLAGTVVVVHESLPFLLKNPQRRNYPTSLEASSHSV